MGYQLTLCTPSNSCVINCYLKQFVIYNLSVKQFGSQMRPHVVWGLIWIPTVCIGHQRLTFCTLSNSCEINCYLKQFVIYNIFILIVVEIES